MRNLKNIIGFFCLVSVILFSSCKTLDVKKYYTQADRNVLPNVETSLDYTTENLFYLNAFANMKVFYKRVKQDLISDAQLIYYNELEKFHARSGAPLGKLQVKVKSINLQPSAIWATVISGVTFCTLNLFGFPLLGYKCTASLEIMILDQKQTLIGIYPGKGDGKSLSGLYFSYNVNDAQKKAHLESFRNALADALNQVEADKANIISKLSQKVIPSDTKVSVPVEEKNLVPFCDVDSVPDFKPKSRANLFALVIGNEDYKKYQDDLSNEANVEYARRDAAFFAEYCKKVIGVPEENMVVLKDAIGSQIKREIEKISKLAKYSNGEAEIIFYYAGHGFPDEETKEPYIIPCDISGAQVKDGIKLSWLFEKLSAAEIKRATVFLDACFSGGARNKGLVSSRGVKIVPKNSPVPEKVVVFAASSSDQSSFPFKEKQHGIFTYYLLKYLMEKKGSSSYKDLYDFLYMNVGKNSIRQNNTEQEPTIEAGQETKKFLDIWKIVE